MSPLDMSSYAKEFSRSKHSNIDYKCVRDYLANFGWDLEIEDQKTLQRTIRTLDELHGFKHQEYQDDDTPKAIPIQQDSSESIFIGYLRDSLGEKTTSKQPVDVKNADKSFMPSTTSSTSQLIHNIHTENVATVPRWALRDNESRSSSDKSSSISSPTFARYYKSSRNARRYASRITGSTGTQATKAISKKSLWKSIKNHVLRSNTNVSVANDDFSHLKPLAPFKRVILKSLKMLN